VLAAGLSPDPRPWGLHALAFLPRWAWLAAALAILALAHPSLAAPVGRWVPRGAAQLQASTLGIALVALVAAALFALLRLRYQFLGDGIVWFEKIQQRGAFHHFEPLSTFIVRTAAHFAPGTRAAAQAPSILCGVIWIVATAFACRAAFATDAAARGLAWTLLVVHPILLLFFGYVESYPLLLALQAVCVALWIAGGSRRAIVAGAIVTGAAIATHLQAVTWLPALAIAAAHGARPGSARTRWGWGLAAIALACGVAVLATRAVGASPTELVRALVGAPGVGGLAAGDVVAWQRGLDVANEAASLLGAAAILAVAAAASRDGSWLRQRPWLVLAALGTGAALVWIFPPRIGAARDWDLYTAVVLPAVLVAVEAWRRARAAWPPQGADALQGRVVGLALVCTVAWLGSQIADARAAERMIVLQDRRGTFSNFARGYANEALGMYYRTRAPEEARKAYARAVEANPKNARYWNNLAMHELMRNNAGAARDAWRRAIDLGMQDWYVYYNMTLVALQLGDLPDALRLGDEMARRFPDHWQTWACRGQALLQAGRAADAVVDLERATTLAPQQAEIWYALGMARREAGQTEAAGAAFGSALRLDPGHADARRELDALRSRPARATP
jgi:tetratricopeptide (TPR) repeat protein